MSNEEGTVSSDMNVQESRWWMSGCQPQRRRAGQPKPNRNCI